MIYPTPNPELPFLGVHYTRRTDGKVIVGPNAVLAFGREAYDNTDVNPRELLETLTYGGFQRLLASPLMLAVAWSELNKSYRKEKFAAASQKLVPEVRAEDLQKSYAGIRAQLVSEDGELVKDPLFVEREDAVHILNAVSPGSPPRCRSATTSRSGSRQRCKRRHVRPTPSRSPRRISWFKSRPSEGLTTTRGAESGSAALPLCDSLRHHNHVTSYVLPPTRGGRVPLAARDRTTTRERSCRPDRGPQ